MPVDTQKQGFHHQSLLLIVGHRVEHTGEDTKHVFHHVQDGIMTKSGVQKVAMITHVLLELSHDSQLCQMVVDISGRFESPEAIPHRWILRIKKLPVLGLIVPGPSLQLVVIPTSLSLPV